MTPTVFLNTPGIGRATPAIQYGWAGDLVTGSQTGAWLPHAVGANGAGLTQFADGFSLDPLSRLRISESVYVFNSRFQYGLRDLAFFEDRIAGGTITYLGNPAMASLNVSATLNSFAAMQSRTYCYFTSGKGCVVLLGQLFGAGKAGIRKRAGYFDLNDGVYLEQNGTTDVALTIRSSVSGAPVETRVAQSSWNLDQLNGSGPSGYVLDLSKVCMVIMDFSWMSMNRMRVGFYINGMIVYVHEFLASNILAQPYMRSSNLPIRWEIQNLTGANSDSLQVYASSVQAEDGQQEEIGFPFCASTPASITATTTRTHMLSIRPATGYNGRVNRIQIKPLQNQILAGNNPVLVETFYQCTLTGGAWNSTNINSSVEWGTGQQITTLGVPIDCFFLGSSNANQGTYDNTLVSHYPLVLDISGQNPIPLTIAVTAISTTSDCRAGINWLELR